MFSVGAAYGYMVHRNQWPPHPGPEAERTLAAYLAAVIADAPDPAADASRVQGEVYASARHDFRVVTVTADLEHPWSMAWLPDGDILVTERPGRMRVIRDGTLDPSPIAGWPEPFRKRGRGGFMDVLPHPDFIANKLVYLSYAKPNEDGSVGATAVVRGRLRDGRVDDVEEIFASVDGETVNGHFSGRMVFDPAGYLFLAVGDRLIDPDRQADHPSQSLSNHTGTIVRLHADGRVPSDNPFVGRADALPEIWSYGHRVMQGLAIHPATGALWSTEHGPRGGDELNLILRGHNYGWPVVSHGIHYDGRIITTETERDGMESPRFVWVPSIGTSGLVFYAGAQFPWWRGSAFVGGLVGQRVDRITLSDGLALSEETLLRDELGRIRDVREGPDGFIYLAIESDPALPLPDIVRLEPVAGEIVAPR